MIKQKCPICGKEMYYLETPDRTSGSYHCDCGYDTNEQFSDPMYKISHDHMREYIKYSALITDKKPFYGYVAQQEAFENKVSRLIEIIHECGLNHFVDATIHKDEFRQLEQELMKGGESNG